MIGLDTNVIIAALVSSQTEHASVLRWLKSIDSPLSVTTTNIAEVLRLLTHLRVFIKPMKLAAALDLLDDFFATYHIMILADDADWWLKLRDVAKKTPALRGNDIHDARIVLTFAYHGVTQIATFDSDFLKYSSVRIITPS